MMTILACYNTSLPWEKKLEKVQLKFQTKRVYFAWEFLERTFLQASLQVASAR